MNNKLFLVNVAYNGNRPRVSISISWRNFFRGIWQNIVNFFRCVNSFMQQQWLRRNVYALWFYTLAIAICETIMAVYCINTLKAVDADANMFMQELWSEWTAFLGEYGVNVISHQVGLLVVVIALFAVLSAPAAEWGKFSAKVRSNSQLTSAEKWNVRIQKADAMVDHYNALITGTCGWILKIAGATAIVWFVWTMLQG